MKRVLYSLIMLMLMTMCNEPQVAGLSDEDGGVTTTPEEPDKEEPTQDYTSFVFVLTEDVFFSDCMVAYRDENKHFHRITDLGDLWLDAETAEVKLQDENITEIYFFAEYIGLRRFREPFVLKKNRKNVFELKSGMGGYSVTDPTDPKQYPQD